MLSLVFERGGRRAEQNSCPGDIAPEGLEGLEGHGCFALVEEVVDNALATKRSERLVIRQARKPPQGEFYPRTHVRGKTFLKFDEFHDEVDSTFVVETTKKFGNTNTVLLLRLECNHGWVLIRVVRISVAPCLTWYLLEPSVQVMLPPAYSS